MLHCIFCSLSLSAVGMYFCFAKLTDHNIFIILYGLTSVYFAVSHMLLHVLIGQHRIAYGIWLL